MVGEDHHHDPRAPSEGVVVDIGDSVGALVVTTTADLDGAQIYICPRGGDLSSRTHNIVRPRAMPGGRVVYAGVFPALEAGEYVLLSRGDRPETAFSISGGAVTELDWS